MEEEILRPGEDELMEQEDKCRRSLKTVGKAVFMRLFVTGLLIWVLVQSAMDLWIIGLIALVLLINLTGLLPLVSELRKRRAELKSIMDQYE